MAAPKKPNKGPDGWVLDADGNPCRLSPEVYENLVAQARKGRWPTDAAIACGVHPKTLVRWLVRGAEKGAIEPYVSFTQAFLSAEQQFTADLEDVLVDHALGTADPQKPGYRPNADTAKYLLERRRPEMWSGSGTSAMGIIIKAAESRPLREATVKFLQSLPEEFRVQARKAGFMIAEPKQIIESEGAEQSED